MLKDIKNGAEDGGLERKIKFRKNFWKWKPVFHFFSPAFAHSLARSSLWAIWRNQVYK